MRQRREQLLRKEAALGVGQLHVPPGVVCHRRRRRRIVLCKRQLGLGAVANLARNADMVLEAFRQIELEGEPAIFARVLRNLRLALRARTVGHEGGGSAKHSRKERRHTSTKTNPQCACVSVCVCFGRGVGGWVAAGANRKKRRTVQHTAAVARTCSK